MASNNSDENKSWAQKAFEAVEQAAAKKEREIPESIKVPGLPVAVQPSEYDAPSGGGVWGDVAKGLYNTAMSDYNRLKSMYTDQTEEAKKIRSTWETAPTVSVKNGRLKLSGSKDFLASPEAKQLRETMKGMQGSTYNTEDLNKQIESWNAVLAQMSEQYVNSLDTLNSMNAAIAQTVSGTTREDFQKYLTLSDLQKIGNSAAVGKQPDARKTKNKIFVGYEWDDEGNMVEKWVDAADFFNEFNDQSDDKKRSAYHSLITQANLGDVGAYSKLMYLQGGSQGGPANVDVDSAGTFFENILQGAEAGAAGVLQDIFDYAPILNLRTIGGNISNAAENADQRNFWDWAAAIMAPGLYADKYDTRTGLLKVYNDAVTDFNNLRDWSNTYTAELNPASTEIGRTVGDFAGGALRIAGDIYAFGKLGQLQADTKFAAMQIANQKFAGSSAFTPMGQIYIKKVGVQVADQVTPLANNGGVATMGTILRDTTTVTPFGGIYVPTVLTKISPKFTQFLEEAALAFTEVQFARSASQFISKDGTTVLQFGTASPASTSRMTWTTEGGIASGQGGFVEGAIQWGSPKTFTSGSNIRSAWDTFSQTFDSTPSSSTALSNTVNFSRSYELLKSLRNKDTILGISKGLQTAQALSNLVGFAAMRNVDDYFQRVEAGEDVGDMADYIITHTAEDAVWGGLIMKAGGMMKFFKRGADASAKPTVEYVQEVYDGMKNSQSGWYMPGTYASSRFMLGPGELTESEVSDITSTLSTVMTTNGEAIVGFSGELGGVSAVPGTNIKEAGKALGVYSPSKITRLSVQPANGGAYLIREETNLDTNTKVETRKFYTDIEEATKAAGAEAVPKTSPKTLENSDQVNNAKVAPLTIDGKAPNVMPDGVSQVRVQPGIVYRTPDNIVESLINIAAQEGWHETNQDRLYREYEQYQREVEAQQNAMEILSGEAPALPREMYGTDIERLLRLAAAAKVAGFSYVPFNVAPKRSRIVKKFSMRDKFVQGLVKKFDFPEISLLDLAAAESTGQDHLRSVSGAGPLELVVNGEIPNEKVLIDRAEDGDFVDSSISNVAESMFDNGNYGVTSNDVMVPVDKYGEFFVYRPGEKSPKYAAHVPAGTKVISLTPTDERNAGNFTIYVFDSREGFTTGGTVTTRKNRPVSVMNDYWLDRIKMDTGVDLRELPFKIDESSLGVTDMLDDTPNEINGKSAIQYYADDKGVRGAVVLMSAEGYLWALERFGNMNADIREDIRNDEDTKKYTEAMRRGDKFPIPAIGFNEKGYSGDQEGRHRAFAAINNDVKIIPVAIRYPADTVLSTLLISNGIMSFYGSDEVQDITLPISKIITNNNPDNEANSPEPTGTEIFLRKAGGAEHKPKEEYEFSIYAQPYDWYGDYSGRINPNFEKFGEEIVERTNKKVESAKDIVEGDMSLYELLNPFGNINTINGELRKKKYGGELPKDTVSYRANLALDYLKRNPLELPKEGSADDQGDTSAGRVRRIINEVAAIIENLDNFSGHNTRYTFVTYGSRLDNAISLAYRALGKITNNNPEYAEMLRENVDDKYLKKVWDYIFDVDNIRDTADGMILDAFSSGVRTPDLSGLQKYLEEAIKNLDAKYSKILGSSKKDYGSIARLIDKNLRNGTHKIKLPDTQKYLWTSWGATTAGNAFGTPNNVHDDLRMWEPGYRGKTSDIRFGTLNPLAAVRYAQRGSMRADERPADSYVVFDGHPNNTGLVYYGDQKMFPGLPVGEKRADQNFWVADGGRIANAYGEGYTIVSKRLLGKNEVGGDIYLVIRVMNDANGEPYSGDIDVSGTVKAAERVMESLTIEEPNNFVVSAYGVPFEYFPTAEEALDFASQNNVFEVHELSDEPMTLDRPPVTTETLDEPLLLESGASAENHLERLTGLLQSMQEMEDSDINYSYGIIDALKQMRGIYGQVSANVNLTDIYARYAQSIYEGQEIKLTPDERRALKPLTDALDALGHYFDPSGKSLTKEFYLPTGAATRNKVSIEEALLGEDEIVDAAMPLDGGLEEILIDADRIGDSGFWQKRTGELFMDSEGNFTMSKAAPLEDNLIAYTVSALTRGPHKLTLAVNNEVARSKANPNRTQITAKQARAMLQEADTLRTKTRSYQLGTHKDAEKIAKLKMDYTGDESTVDQALREKNYAKKLNYTRALNTLSQKGGFNQFLDIHPIKGSVTRFGAGPYKGTANIKRKMSEINITGTMYKYDNGHWENYGFGIEPSQANIKKYGVFKDGGDPVNLGEILKFNFESQQRALDFYGKLKENLKNYAAGDGEALQVQLDTFARENFPLHTNIDSFSAKLMKEFGKNLYAYNNDVIAAEAANVDSVEKWLRTGSLICFNNAIQMGDIQNLDGRTIEALDDAAAELLLGSPVKRSAAINFLQRWSVDSALSLNANLVIGNVGSEIFTRLPGYVGTPETIRAVVNALRPSEFRRVRNILKDLPLHFDDSNSALARRVYNRVSEAVSKGEDVALSFLNWSELFKNVVYYLAGERNAMKSGITDPVEIGQQALNFVGEHAIAGGRGTTPGIAQSDLGRVLFIFKTFTIRNFDDFLDFVKKASHGRSGDNYWDKKYEKRHKGDDKDTIDLKIAARVIGGRAFRSYIFWLFVGSYLGKSLLDILGGDPTGILEGGYDRGLYDDPDTQEYEGMTDFDNFINNIPAGFILGALQDLYFAARRRGIESKQFFALDIFNDQRLQKDLSKKLPLGVAKNRLGDMLSLLDRGYSFSSTGKKTYAAPDTVWDLTKGFLFGKSTTANSLAYGKYRYGNVNIWGDISSGDWMDFAINANPLTDIFGGSAQFDTTRKDYTGVFNGSWNDIATMQLIVRDFRDRNEQIIANFQENKYKWTGEYQNLTDAEKLAKAKDQREKDIDKFTDDVQRAVDAFTKAGNTLSDSQITTMMNLFDFHEGEENDEWNSSYARERYVEAGLPDYSALGIKRVEKKTDEGTEEETQNILDRSLILKNAQQGFYGSSKEAANAIKDALKDFGSTYKAYNTRVKALNNKYFEARNKNKKSAETKKLSQDLEKLQNEYLDKLFDKIAPVIDQYGTALVGTYDGADVLSEYMGNMIPYSSIKEYGQTYSSGNDVVYGQLTEWLQKRLGRNAPTAPSDKEVTSGISDIKKLIDQGKTAAAKSKARAILEKIGRGSLGARRDDVETLRSYVYD